jgi:hypothetical protein
VCRGTTPASVTLDASAGYFDGQKYTVTFSKDGYDPTTVQIDSRINGWYVGNIVFGRFIGWLIVDPLTGAMWALDCDRRAKRHRHNLLRFCHCTCPTDGSILLHVNGER